MSFSYSLPCVANFRASPDMITLHFHGIIESKFKYDWRKAQLYVRFKDPSLGGYFGSIKPQQQLQKVRLVLSCVLFAIYNPENL